MAERYIDGMRVFVDGQETEVPEVGIPIEVASFGQDPKEDVIEVSSPEEYEQARDAYDRAQQISSLKGFAGFSALLESALEDAQQAVVSERSYRGMNEEKSKELRLARIVADSIYHFLRSTVDDAESVPRPEFNR